MTGKIRSTGGSEVGDLTTTLDRKRPSATFSSGTTRCNRDSDMGEGDCRLELSSAHLRHDWKDDHIQPKAAGIRMGNAHETVLALNVRDARRSP